MTQTIDTQTPDLAAVKARQQLAWASGDYHAIAARIVPIAEQLVDAADLRAGWRVLDVAAGSGNSAIAAARLGCSVVGVDYVPSLLERARQRAAAEGLDVTFADGDAEALPCHDGEYDAVISVLGSMFAPDHQKAADELLRACRPGGTIALASWTPDGFIGQLFRTVAAHVTPPAGVASPMLWGTEQHLRRSVRRRHHLLRRPRAHFHLAVRLGRGVGRVLPTLVRPDRQGLRRAGRGRPGCADERPGRAGRPVRPPRRRGSPGHPGHLPRGGSGPR